MTVMFPLLYLLPLDFQSVNVNLGCSVMNTVKRPEQVLVSSLAFDQNHSTVLGFRCDTALNHFCLILW
jgi:hypothetical protein